MKLILEEGLLWWIPICVSSKYETVTGGLSWIYQIKIEFLIKVYIFNREAARRCRERRRNYIEALESNIRTLESKQKSLMTENTSLHKEVQTLKKALSEHKDCFLAKNNNGPILDQLGIKPENNNNNNLGNLKLC